ncbi:structural maintenance of chromosomes protein 3 [Pelomyxa schiedti]|nr:structural maintenance of chromosomes protein 3 [Pelomyxa schiedti]
MVFIKRVLLHGFKSYYDQTSTADTFHPGYNVVVGDNGSGKSNLLDGIRFVLFDEKYTNLRVGERSALIHQPPSGETLLSAFVEIHFDNSDGRFPTEGQEVVLRRSIGAKKDEYYLDRKHVTKADVANILESAGISKSNPYYIVQQFRVTELSLMRDSDRLELLKDVAGTRVYDERREESSKILRDTKNKTENIDSVLKYIQDRLRELEEEQAELGEYEKLDKLRRSLEYCLYNKEYTEACNELQQLEENRSNKSEKAAELTGQLIKLQDTIHANEKRAKELSRECAVLNRDKEAIEDDRQELIQRRTIINLDVIDKKEKLSRETEKRDALDREIEEVDAQIAAANSKLKSITPLCISAAQEYDTLRKQIDASERRIAELYAKQGRVSQFKTVQARNEWLTREITENKRQLAAKSQQLRESEAEASNLKTALEKDKLSVTQGDKNMDEWRQHIAKAKSDIATLKGRRDVLQNSKKEHQLLLYEKTSKVGNITHERQRAERLLEASMNKVVSQGLTAIQRIVREQPKYRSDSPIKTVYGPVIENFEVPDEFMTAVEVTAGNSLFHVIVKSDDIAAQLLEELNKRKEGRVTFMPLNRLLAKEEALPQTSDVVPLLQKLTFAPELRRVFVQLFGRTLVCRNLEIAQAFSKSHNCNCVTLDGDQVNRRGVLTGGFYDVHKSRMKARNTIIQIAGQAKELVEEQQKEHALVADMELKLNTVLGEIQKKEAELQRTLDAYQRLLVDQASQTKDVQSRAQILDQKQLVVSQNQATIAQIKSVISSLETEMSSPLQSQLSAMEEEELQKLQAQTTEGKSKLISLAPERTKLESEMIALRTLLDNNLLKRQQDQRQQRVNLIISDTEGALQSSISDLESATAALETANKQRDSLVEKIEGNLKKTQEIKEHTEELKQEEKRHQAILSEEARKTTKLLTRHSILQQKKEEGARKIRELGSVPGDAAQYAANSRTELMNLLQTTNTKLASFSHVNKKARDQYVMFTKRQEDLQARRKELDEGAIAIRDLIDQLDQKKDEAIERTFKGVAKFFLDVFQLLVPGGKASLVMQRKDLPNTEDSSLSSQSQGEASQASQTQSGRPTAKGKMSEYIGVGIKVSFPGSSEAINMQQLSGGQKTVVALALIFAIQRTDPAPFYLFDEVDSFLDETYHTRVADMIKEQAKQAQFIVTSYHNELVDGADKWYLAQVHNKASTVTVVDKATALQVVQARNVHPVKPTDDEERIDEDEA